MFERAKGDTHIPASGGKALAFGMLREDVLPFADQSFPQARVGSNRDGGDSRPNPTRLIYLSGTAPDLSTTAHRAGRRSIVRSRGGPVKAARAQGRCRYRRPRQNLDDVKPRPGRHLHAGVAV